jgi:putative metallohydrolase (TIGR04338 family)
MTRDSARRRVYDAEQVVWDMVDRGADVLFHDERLMLAPDRKFGQVADVERYLDWLRKHAWAAPQTPRPRVRLRRGAARATYTGPGTIALPDAGWARRELVVLHEYAHHMVWHESAGAESGHGPRFCRTLAELVRQAVGPGAGLLLIDAFHTEGLLGIAGGSGAGPPGTVAGWPP